MKTDGTNAFVLIEIISVSYTHLVRETLSITDKSYIMAKGKVLLEGTPREIANNPEARRIYLGEKFRLD